MVGYLMNIAVVLIHTLGHHPNTQPEPQDKILQRRSAVDFMLGLDQFGEERLFCFAQPLCELLFTPADRVYRTAQAGVGSHFLYAA